MKNFPELTLPFSVRDYECDLQGIVNHAVYLHYFEHARHEYLKAMGFSFAELTSQNKFLVITKAEVSYKRSLRSGDSFHVVSQMTLPKQLKAVFLQKIVHDVDSRIMVEAEMTIAYLANGRPSVFSELF